MVQTPIWMFFSKEGGKAECRLCQRRLRLHNTSVLVRHLRAVHPDSYEVYRREFFATRRAVGYSSRSGILPVQNNPNVKKVIVLKPSSDPGADVVTSQDLGVLAGKNIRILSVVSKRASLELKPDEVVNDDGEVGYHVVIPEAADDEEVGYRVIPVPSNEADADGETIEISTEIEENQEFLLSGSAPS